MVKNCLEVDTYMLEVNFAKIFANTSVQTFPAELTKAADVNNLATSATQAAVNFVGNPALLGVGLVLFIVAIILILFLKRIIVNSLLGIGVWAIAYYIFNVRLPFELSLIVSAIFGLAGIGTLLILRFLGIL